MASFEMENVGARREPLYQELQKITTTHHRRLEIGEQLAEIGDTHSGIGLKDILPDILWLPVQNSLGKHHFEYGMFEIKPLFIAKYLVTVVQYQAFVEKAPMMIRAGGLVSQIHIVCSWYTRHIVLIPILQEIRYRGISVLRSRVGCHYSLIG